MVLFFRSREMLAQFQSFGGVSRGIGLGAFIYRVRVHAYTSVLCLYCDLQKRKRRRHISPKSLQKTNLHHIMSLTLIVNTKIPSIESKKLHIYTLLTLVAGSSLLLIYFFNNQYNSAEPSVHDRIAGSNIDWCLLFGQYSLRSKYIHFAMHLDINYTMQIMSRCIAK